MEEDPDYTMDEFERINPFCDDFRTDAPTPAPAPSPTSSSPPSPPPPYDIDDDDDDDNEFHRHPHHLKKVPHEKSRESRGRLSLNMPMNQPCCKRSIS